MALEALAAFRMFCSEIGITFRSMAREAILAHHDFVWDGGRRIVMSARTFARSNESDETILSKEFDFIGIFTGDMALQTLTEDGMRQRCDSFVLLRDVVFGCMAFHTVMDAGLIINGMGNRWWCVLMSPSVDRLGREINIP